MQVYEIRDGFGMDHLQPASRPEPEPGPHEVKIKVRAVSLNYRDLLVIKGLYNPKLRLPCIPASDGVGEVVAVGDGVTRVQVGDRVAAIFAQSWLDGESSDEKARLCLGSPLDGMLCEYRVLGEEGVVHVPVHLSDEEAATLPCAAVTAWNALVGQGRVKAGDTVLTQGTGGVSLFALQFAKLLGARVIITSSSDEKLQRARALGAADGINYKTTPDWDQTASQLTQGIGVDHIVELGGAGTLPLSLRAVRRGGHVSLIGVLTGRGEIDPIGILMRSVRVQGIFVGSRTLFEDMNRAITLHQLRPIVDRVFPFSETPEALRYMESGSHFGKIVIRVA